MNTAATELPHFPILYAILRPALASGNAAVRHHMERLAEVLTGDELAAVRELLDRPAQNEPVPRVVHSGRGGLGDGALRPLPIDEWHEAERIRDLPEVDSAIKGFIEDHTGDNATCVVRAVIRAAGPPRAGTAGLTLEALEVRFLAARLRRLFEHFKVPVPDAADDARLIGNAAAGIGLLLPAHPEVGANPSEHAVYHALSPRARLRTSPENVSDVLAALAHVTSVAPSSEVKHG